MPRLDDPDLMLSDVMNIWPQTIEVFLKHGMLCVGCLVNPFHTVADACTEYDLDEEVFRTELQRAVDGQG